MTEYVIFSNTDDGGPRWQEVQRLKARSAKAAISAYLKPDSILDESQSGLYAAVPARSWQPVKVQVETALKFS